MANVDQNSPAFMLWCVEGDGKDARWTRIGAAWKHLVMRIPCLARRSM